MTEVPTYLKGYEKVFEENPHEAAKEWFKNAKYGLFLHYGLYSLLGRHEWVQLREKISVAEYEKLKEQFTAEKFDADYLVDFAIDCGMKYINLTTRHHDSFCLFNTKETDFNSVNSTAKRDLVRDLAHACQKKGIGLFLYYSHGRDWKHPHAPNNDEYGGRPRPEYDPPETTYASGGEHDLQKYVDFMSAQITELLTNYGPIAGIWLDGIGVLNHGDASKFKVQELYDTIHSLQPQTLVSYKQGLLGTEDFCTPERKAVDKGDGKLVEINTTMCPKSWGYTIADAGQHKKEEDVWEQLRVARSQGCNLLLNTGPLPDGSLDPEDEPVLRAVGARIRKEGFPV